MTKYFNKYKLKYCGFDKRSKFINHHRLCRYAAIAEYIYGKKLTIKKFRKMIINYITPR